MVGDVAPAGRWLPIVALVAFAVEHFALVQCCDLHPWLGGGFGMFSTVDARRVTATRIDPEGERAIGIPEALQDAADRCEGLPTEGCVRDLATAIAARPEQGGSALRVEVWETHFDRDMRPVPRRLRAVTVHGPPVSP